MRDITFTPVTGGVRIAVVTDIACRLYCRLTTQHPWIHKKAVKRRGLWLNDDVRFCFTVFEDTVQDEVEDTPIHTFTLRDWPVCTTKWSYFWADMGGDVSPSTSPIFLFHREDYVPTAGFFAYTPDLCVVLASGSWTKVTHVLGGSLTDLLPSNASVAFLHIVNRGAPQNIGLRPVNSTHTQLEWQNTGAHQWAPVALDDNNNFEIYLQNHLNFDVYLIGYATSEVVVMLDNPIEKTPSDGNAWQTIDLSAECPDAIGILTEVLSDSTGEPFGIRKRNSTDNRLTAMRHDWPVIGCDYTQNIEFYPSKVGPNIGKLFITGYVKNLATFLTNAIDKSLAVTSAFQTISLTPGPALAFLEIYAPLVSADMALRAVGSPLNLFYEPNWRHTWAIVAIDAAGHFEGKIQNLGTDFYHVAVGTH